jgi:hypothetical protein
MAICPVANSVGCNKCGMVNFCFLKSVFGNYGEEQPGQSEETETTGSESKQPD